MIVAPSVDLFITRVMFGFFILSTKSMARANMKLVTNVANKFSKGRKLFLD